MGTTHSSEVQAAHKNGVVIAVEEDLPENEEEIVSPADPQRAQATQPIGGNVKDDYLASVKPAAADPVDLPFRLGKTIGTGAFGKVKLGVHNKTGERIAVKVVPRDKLGDVKVQTNMAREIKMMKLLRNEHIIRLYDVVVGRTKIYLALEYADGGDMLSYVNSNPPMSEAQAGALFVQVLEGVSFCHKLGVCHRDLKLENLLLCGSTIKIADFGLSKFVDEQNRLESYAGSPQYLAPELVDEVVSFDGCAADMWSCGVVLYALLFRGLPFDAPSLEDILANIVLGKYKLTRPVSAEASALLASLLNADPPKRLTAADALEAAWIVANREGPADQALTGGGIAEATPRGVAMRGSKAVSTDTMLSNVAQKLQLKRKAEEAGIRMPSIPSALPSRLERRTQDDALPPSQSRRLYRLDPAPALLERS